MAGNHAEWTSEQMIEKANSWSLAGDVALLNSLKKFSQSLLSETELVNANVDNLLNNLENVTLKLDLTKNEFQSLRNTQFIENRVYEDDETIENEQNKKEEKELTKEEKESAIKESIVKGLKVMEQYFEKIEVSVSDSEEENDKSYILQAKDPYADRPLPYLVGSQDWYKKWHVGLLPSESESESEKEEEVYSSSEDEGLPKDRNLGSETSSELDFTNRHAGPVANSTFNDSEDHRREIFHSSDESSDQSNSLPVKGPISNEKFAEQLAAKLGDVISGTSDKLPRVNRNPLKKMNEATKYGNLFSDEPPPLDDLEDTVLPKSAHQGLFSGGRDLFGDSEDDLFWGQSNTTSKNIKSSEDKPSLFSPPDVKSALKVSKGLFDESDSSSEEDMFDAVEKRKVKISQPYLQPLKPAVPFVDDQPPDITSKNDSLPTKKKPVGGVSIFGENANIFGETSGKPGFESTQTAKSLIIESIESKSTRTPKKSLKKTSLFDESSDEDIITSKNKNTPSEKSNSQQTSKKLSLFDDIDDILTPKTGEKKKNSLFDDDDLNSTSAKDDVKSFEEKGKKLDFDENPYQNIDLFRPTTKEINDTTDNLNKTSFDNKKASKKISLFDNDDDDDFLKEEEDIFAPVTKKTGLFDEIAAEPKKTRGTSLFEDTDSDVSSKLTAKEESNAKKSSKSLFDDLETKNDPEIPSTTVEITRKLETKIDEGKKSSKGLFDDLDTSLTSEELFQGSKAADKDTKFVEIKEDSSKSLKEERIDANATKHLKEEEELSKVSNDSEGSQKSKYGNKTAEFKPQGSDNDDFFGGISSNTEEKSVVDEIQTSDVLKVTNSKDSNVTEKTLENLNNSKALDKVGSEEQDISSISSKYATDQADNVLGQNKNDLTEKIGKNVGFLESGSETSSDDDFGFGKKRKELKDSANQVTVESRGDDIKENTLFKPEEPGSSKISMDNSEGTINVTESLLNRDELPKSTTSENYTIPPPIDLFDPTPPPLDWDAVSDNSGESDTFSLTDGILNQITLNQSQARSSLFDEAPPSLDVNESSGIVRDMDVTRMDTDDSSFNPYASSSRRLSSDIFGEQHSHDSFFVTKNRTDLSAQPGSSLEQIPENFENMSSKIENLTPSGDLGDFEESSVFESESKDSNHMDGTTSASEITQEVSLFQGGDKQNVNISPSKSLDVRKRASLFEGNRALDKETDVERNETTEKPLTSPKKTSPGKLQHNLKINVNALMPGARPKFRPDVARSASSDEIDKSDLFSPAVGVANTSRPLIRPIAVARTKNVADSNKQKADDENFESLSQTEVLPSATKDRVRIPIKRRPSSRRARQEAVRKSMTDFSLYQNEDLSSQEHEQSESNNVSLVDSKSEQSSQPKKISQKLIGSDKSRFLKDFHDELRIPDYVPKKETSKKDDRVKKSEEEPEVKGISLVFNEPSEKQDSRILFDSLSGEIGDKTDIFSSLSINSESIEVLKPNNTLSSSKPSEKEEPRPESSIFEDKPDLFKPTSKTRKPAKDKSLFDDEASNSSDDELFSSTKKSLKRDLILPSENPVNVEEAVRKKYSKSNIFSDKSDSDGEGELFGGKSKSFAATTAKKIVGETSKKASIFDDSDGSSEEDLFGSKTPKNKNDTRGNTGSVLGTKRTESKNVKIASVKKLENKEVTDFDPLSALK